MLKNSKPAPQANPTWSKETLGNDKTTIGKSSCAIGSLAAMVGHAGVTIDGRAPDVLNMNNWLKDNSSFSQSLVVWGAMDKLGFEYTGDLAGSNKDAIIKAMSEGKSAILNVGGHFVFATGSDDKGFTVIDPGRKNTNHYAFEKVEAAKMFNKEERKNEK